MTGDPYRGGGARSPKEDLRRTSMRLVIGATATVKSHSVTHGIGSPSSETSGRVPQQKRSTLVVYHNHSKRPAEEGEMRDTNGKVKRRTKISRFDESTGHDRN